MTELHNQVLTPPDIAEQQSHGMIHDLSRMAMNFGRRHGLHIGEVVIVGGGMFASIANAGVTTPLRNRIGQTTVPECIDSNTSQADNSKFGASSFNKTLTYDGTSLLSAQPETATQRLASNCLTYAGSRLVAPLYSRPESNSSTTVIPKSIKAIVTPLQVVKKMNSDMLKNSARAPRDFTKSFLNEQITGMNTKNGGYEYIDGKCNKNDPAKPQIRRVVDRGQFEHTNTCYGNNTMTIPGNMSYNTHLVTGKVPVQEQIDYLTEEVEAGKHIPAKDFADSEVYMAKASTKMAVFKFRRLSQTPATTTTRPRQLKEIVLSSTGQTAPIWYPNK